MAERKVALAARIAGIGVATDGRGQVVVEVDMADFDVFRSLLAATVALTVSLPKDELAIGDLVLYRAVAGIEEVTCCERITAGPFLMDNRRCWKLANHSGVFDELHLSKVVEVRHG